MLTVEAADLSDLIALIWFRLGYQPSNSLILIGVSGPERRVGPVLRADLPTCRQARKVIRNLTAFLVEHEQSGVVAFLVQDDPPAGAEGTGPEEKGTTSWSRHPLVRFLAEEFQRANLDIVDVVVVGDSSYRSCLCSDPDCCPPGGIPLEQVMASRVALEMILRGEALCQEESDLIQDVEPQDTEPEDTEPEQAASEGSAGGDSVGGDAACDGSVGDGSVEPSNVSDPLDGQARLQSLARWRELLTACGPVPEDLRWLGRGLEDHLIRDALILTLVPGADDAAEELLTGRRTTFDEDLTSSPPSPERYERARSLLAAWVRVAPKGARSPGLSVLAWMAWWRGECVRSRLLSERAVRDRPGYKLASLVAKLVAAGIPPEWVGSTPSSPSPASGPDSNGAPPETRQDSEWQQDAEVV